MWSARSARLPGPPPFPPVADRAAWEGVRERLGDAATALIATAAGLRRRADPPGPATLFLDWLRNPTRGEQEYDGTLTERRTRLATLTLAECLEHEGRFLDPLLDTAWSLCEESSWAHPTHVRGLPDYDRPVIDLRVAMTALDLAEIDHLLGARLDPLLRKRIRRELDRRCFAPFLERHDYWWMYNTAARREQLDRRLRRRRGRRGDLPGGRPRAAGGDHRARAALARRLPRHLRRGRRIERGPGYWSYGFGYYTIVAHLVETRTGGRVDFFAGERLRQIARYPLRTILSPGVYVNFSDCDRRVNLSSTHLAFLARRFDIPELMALANGQSPGPRQGQLAWALRGLFWTPDRDAGTTVVPARRDFFRGMHWLIARQDPADPGALVLAAKGGHNQEMHNQNDIGAVIVHLAGESLVADPGRGRYNQAYFGPQRYEHLVNSSLGHATPVPNGQAQLAGREHRAELLAHRATEAEDMMALELRDAYPAEADLASLRRTVALRRDAPRGEVILEDVAQFQTRPGTLESVLITFGQAEIGDGIVTLRGERGALTVAYDPPDLTVRAEPAPQVDLAEGPADLTRVRFAWPEPAGRARSTADRPGVGRTGSDVGRRRGGG